MGMIKLTSKRQGTFPVEVCRQLGVGPGDSLMIEAMGTGDERVWVLKPVKESRPAWLGSLKRYAGNAREPWSREHHGEATGKAMAARLKPS
jgi:bifunctional DNA-binding transcriptional regulator/antitoxin component of YhaV-PrlF toxin-antitoxin module